MDVKVTPHTDKSQVELVIASTAQELAPYIDKAAKQLSTQSPIKGFRPGKVTAAVAMDSFGKDRVLHEALDLAMPKFFVQAVLDHDIEAIARPSITVTTLNADDGLAFTAVVDVIPEVKLGDTATISVTKRVAAATDEEVDKELKVLAKMRATPLDVARPAQKGDTVTLDFRVSIAGTVLEGGESKNHPVHVGEGQFVPGFEDKLIGINAGDTREFTITFPADYAQQALQGKTADVVVTAHAVQQQLLPELNDDFAKKVGKFDSVAALKKTLKENLDHEKEHKELDRFHAELSERLAEISSFGHIPDPLIEREIDSRLQEFSQMLSYQQKTVDDYLQQHRKSLKDIREEMRPASEKAVKIALALRAFATQEKITVEDADVETQLNTYLARYLPAGRQAPVEAAKKEVDIDELRDTLATMLRNKKTLKRLEELVVVKSQADTSA